MIPTLTSFGDQSAAQPEKIIRERLIVHFVPRQNLLQQIRMIDDDPWRRPQQYLSDAFGGRKQFKCNLERFVGTLAPEQRNMAEDRIHGLKGWNLFGKVANA